MNKKILVMIFTLLISMTMANALVSLNTCGTPAGGWINGEIYDVDLSTLDSNTITGTSCYDLNDPLLKDITFDGLNKKVTLSTDKNLFLIAKNSTGFTFNNFNIDLVAYASSIGGFIEMTNDGLSSVDQTYNNSLTINNLVANQYDSVSSLTHIIRLIHTDISGVGQWTETIQDWSIQNSLLRSDNQPIGIYGSIQLKTSSPFTFAELDILFKYDVQNSLLISPDRVTNYNEIALNYGLGTRFGIGGKSEVTGNNFVYLGKNLDYDGVINGVGVSKGDVTIINATNFISKYDGANTQFLDLFGTRYVDKGSDIPVSTINMDIVTVSDEVIGVFNSILVPNSGNTLDTSYSTYVLDSNSGISLITNSINCLITSSNLCFFTDTANTQATGFLDSGYFQISNNALIKGINFQQIQDNDASIISQNTIGSTSGISIVDSILSRTYLTNNPLYYQTMIDLRTTDLVISNNNISFDGNGAIREILDNLGDNVLISDNLVSVDVPDGINGVSMFQITGDITTVSGNNFTTSGDAGNTLGNNLVWFDIYGNQIDFTNNRFVNDMTNVVTESYVFDIAEGGGSFYHNWLDANTVPYRFNSTNISLTKQVNFEFGGKIYKFTLGNYYDGYSNTCADLNGDAICDTGFTLPSGAIDNKTLAQYPYDFGGHLAFADNFFDFQNYSVSVSNINQGSSVTMSNPTPLPIQYSHSASIPLTCDTYLDTTLINSNSNVVGGVTETVYYGSWVYNTNYDLEVICHTQANVERSSGIITFNIINSTISVGGGGAGGGSSSNNDNTNNDNNNPKPDTNICTDSTADNFNQNGNCVYSCTIDIFGFQAFCNDTPAPVTEPSCPPLDLLCTIGITTPDPVKESCAIQITPKGLDFSSDGEVQSFTIKNDDSLSYTPDFRIGNVDGKDSAKSSFEILNSIGTIQPNSQKEIGVRFNINSFNPISSEDKLTLVHSTCADVSVPLKSKLDDQTISDKLFLGGTFSNDNGGTTPQALKSSEIVNKILGIDIKQGSFNSFIIGLLSVIILGGVMSLFITGKNIVKGRTRKAKSNRKVVRILISLAWGVFISLILRTILTLFL